MRVETHDDHLGCLDTATFPVFTAFARGYECIVWLEQRGIAGRITLLSDGSGYFLIEVPDELRSDPGADTFDPTKVLPQGAQIFNEFALFVGSERWARCGTTDPESGKPAALLRLDFCGALRRAHT